MYALQAIDVYLCRVTPRESNETRDTLILVNTLTGIITLHTRKVRNFPIHSQLSFFSSLLYQVKTWQTQILMSSADPSWIVLFMYRENLTSPRGETLFFIRAG